jgi:diguanylate cyclase (GGDEF)-like protein
VDDLDLLLTQQRDLLEVHDGHVLSARYRARHYDGEWRWLSRRMTPFTRDGTGSLTHALAIVTDVTGMVEGEQRLAQQAQQDNLTGLANRRLVEERLRQAIDRIPTHGPVAVLYLDLDGFKNINDRHGHSEGDLVLREIGERLLATVRSHDTVGRVGGDEFVLIINPHHDTTRPNVITELAERVRVAVAQPIRSGDLRHHVTTSIGIALASHNCLVEDVLRAADAAMYQAKHTGKDRIAQPATNPEVPEQPHRE